MAVICLRKGEDEDAMIRSAVKSINHETIHHVFDELKVEEDIEGWLRTERAACRRSQTLINDVEEAMVVKLTGDLGLFAEVKNSPAYKEIAKMMEKAEAAMKLLQDTERLESRLRSLTSAVQELDKSFEEFNRKRRSRVSRVCLEHV